MTEFLAIVSDPLTFERRGSGRYRFLLACTIPRGISDADAMRLVSEMRASEALTSLRRGADYQWEGATKIAFRRLQDAALFRLFFTSDGPARLI